MQLTKSFIHNAIEDATVRGATTIDFNRFSIDSRTLRKGDFFVALSGSAVDGHQFIREAIEKGASGILMECNTAVENLDASDQLCFVVVPNARTAFLSLARAWRVQFTYPVIGITGSVGKTTTKYILSKMLELNGTIHTCSEGNYNTDLGIALSIMCMRSEHQVAIFELGISRRGEMKKLVHLARPTIGIITAIGHSHMAGLGSIETIAAEKRDIFSAFTEADIGVIPGDQRLLSQVGYPHPIVQFGNKMTNQVQARKISLHDDNVSFTLKLYGKKFRIVLPTHLPGRVNNCLAAAAVGYLLQVPSETIVQALQVPVTIAGRFERKKFSLGNGFMIHDAYNANPESMRDALQTFNDMKTSGPKAVVLGDMLELGVNSVFWHRQIGRYLQKFSKIDRIVLIGTHMAFAKEAITLNLNVTYLPTVDTVKDIFNDLIQEDAAVLIKASRGMKFEKLVQEFA